VVVELVADPLMTSGTFTQASLALCRMSTVGSHLVLLRVMMVRIRAASSVRADIRRLLRRSSVLTVGVTGYVTFGT